MGGFKLANRFRFRRHLDNPRPKVAEREPGAGSYSRQGTENGSAAGIFLAVSLRAEC